MADFNLKDILGLEGIPDDCLDEISELALVFSKVNEEREEKEEFTNEALCVFCDFDIKNSKGSGRQFVGSLEYMDKWICGTCADHLHNFFVDSI